MTHYQQLYHRLKFARFPELGKLVGDFPAYDSVVAGYASRLAVGHEVPPEAASLIPDDETLRLVADLRSGRRLTFDEREFLDYYLLLDEVRLEIEAAARRRN